MARKTAITVVGSDVKGDIDNARRLGQLIAEKDWVVITGGRNSGVMHAACEGAHGAQPKGLTVGILPEAKSDDVSSEIDIAIYTDMHNARNNVNVISGDVVIACGSGRAGTVSEIALALKNKKTVILLGCAPDAVKFLSSLGKNVHVVTTPEEAITKTREILGK